MSQIPTYKDYLKTELIPIIVNKGLLNKAKYHWQNKKFGDFINDILLLIMSLTNNI